MINSNIVTSDSLVLDSTLFDSYKTWLILGGRRERTVKMHLRTISELILKGHLKNYDSFEKFVVSLKQRNISSSHINNYINSMKQFYHYCDENQIPYDKKLTGFRQMADKYKPRATMGDSEIEAFLNLPCLAVTRIHPRNKQLFVSYINLKKYNMWTLFFSICAFTGMRPGEVANLRVEDCDFGRTVFNVLVTKTNEPRYVPIPPNINVILKKRIKEVETGFLFPSKRPSGIVSNSEWHYNFHSRIKRLGIVRPNLCPYSLRHTFITSMLEQDINLFKVQKIVGHKKLETTAHYTHLTTKDIVATIQKHPLVRKGTNPANMLKLLEGFVDSLDLYSDDRLIVTKKKDNKSFYLKVEIINDETQG